MNERAIAVLVGEIGHDMEGSRIAAVAEARGCVRLELTMPGGARRQAISAVDKAMPLFFLGGPDVSECSGEPRPFLAELRGAVVSSVSASGTAIRIDTIHTHPSGRTTERTLVLDLGRRPVVRVEEGNPADPAAASPESGSGLTTVSARRDRSGRLHVKIEIGGSPAATDETRTFETVNEAASHAFATYWKTLDLERRRAAVRKAIARLAKRKARALEKVRQEAADARRADEYRHHGQLLLTRLSDVRRGVTPVRVLDYDNETEVEIDVDPTLGPTQNAEALFRMARKAERRSRHAPARVTELEAEAAELERLSALAAEAGEDELRELELTYGPRSTKEEKAPPPARFRTYTVSGGWEVLVGRSNADNDLLTHRVAAPDDIWFHARQAAGSHVILRRAGKKAEPDRRAILEAAAIAAFHSKAGKSSRVAVSYTEKRHVRKPRGAKPGLAVMKREKTVIVDPALPEG